MAVTSAVKALIPSKLRSNDDSNNDADSAAHSGNTDTDSPRREDQDDLMAHEEEMDFVSQWEEETRTMSPSQIVMEPEQKKVGHSSHHLRLDDFELLKTLGTGAPFALPPYNALAY